MPKSSSPAGTKSSSKLDTDKKLFEMYQQIEQIQTRVETLEMGFADTKNKGEVKSEDTTTKKPEPQIDKTSDNLPPVFHSPWVAVSAFVLSIINFLIHIM